MAVDKEEGVGEKVKDFFTQKPEDRAYEDAGGDDQVPVDQRTDDPKADANRHAEQSGEAPPYPEHQPNGVAQAEARPSEVGDEGQPPTEAVMGSPGSGQSIRADDGENSGFTGVAGGSGEEGALGRDAERESPDPHSH